MPTPLRHCSLVASPPPSRVVLKRPAVETTFGPDHVPSDHSEIRVSVTAGPDAGERFHGLLGRSACMRELFADLARIAPTDMAVLIEGETGSGKELVAESVHAASERASGPLVVFDCSSVVPTLVESELFGHERGAYTNAVASRAGVFEQADGGTLFLDELGELPKDMQAKLLRVLEQREVKRVGGNKSLPVNVRLVAATNRDLKAEVQRGNFRADLYYRLAVATVHVPPLRARRDDLPLLVDHFLSRTKPARSGRDLPASVWAMFDAHGWPGNVRELANAVQRFIVTPERVLISAADPEPKAARVTASGDLPLPLRVARREASENFERAYLSRVLECSEGRVTDAAAIARVSRQMFHRLIRKHGMDRGATQDSMR